MVELCAGRRRAAAVALPRAVAVAVANNSMALPPIFLSSAGFEFL